MMQLGLCIPLPLHVLGQAAHPLRWQMSGSLFSGKSKAQDRFIWVISQTDEQTGPITKPKKIKWKNSQYSKTFTTHLPNSLCQEHWQSDLDHPLSRRLKESSLEKFDQLNRKTQIYWYQWFSNLEHHTHSELPISFGVFHYLTWMEKSLTTNIQGKSLI